MDAPTAALEDEWLWGWDPTPGIVSVWAEEDGRALVWRRDPEHGALLRDEQRFRPWLLLDRLDDLLHLGDRLCEGANAAARISYRELDGPGALRYLVSADNYKTLTSAILLGATQRLRRRVEHVRELGADAALTLPPDEQYLVATGRNYFRDLSFDQLHRLQFDLETTGLFAEHDRIFMVSVRFPDGNTDVLEATAKGDVAEADLIRRLVATIRAADPDVIENHNLHGFDLPFLYRRARRLGVRLDIGRTGSGLRRRAARRGVKSEDDEERRVRFVAPGRELIDTIDAVRRYDYTVRALPSYGLKSVARQLGLAGPDRELIRGDQIYTVYQTDPARVRRYAIADVDEVAALSRTLGGPAFALARMVPRRYERIADAGAATGMIDPLLVRAYLHTGTALPAHEESDGTPHSGAALHLFATGVAHRVVKADVASLYPSLMRTYRIGPARDHLGALLALVDRLVEQRLTAKAAARQAPNVVERHAHEAMSSAMKLVVNSAYGYLAAGGGLTRFADVHAANEVTRRGRETLDIMCRSLAERGVTLLEADTDGVYFAVPESWSEDDERRAVSEVAALMPPLVQLELEGRYAAMLSHEPKNYALLGYDGSLLLRGVAFRSRRAEPFGEAFLRHALHRLLVGDVAAVRAEYIDTIDALRRREISTLNVAARVRLTKTPDRYLATRESRRELPYEAMFASGRTTWHVGDKIRVYRTTSGTGAVVPEVDDEGTTEAGDPRDYDVAHYERVLRDNFAARLGRAFRPDDYAIVFADPDQPSLFAPPVDTIRTVLIRRVVTA
ncbi:MAG TPA: DNA polymerase domain-containing protein [Gemmatimonadaceae bacterium]|jgi:DNA polymerase elongation subunit (family B)